MFKVTVKIMSIDENSGGTGSILESGPSGSLLLTNKHVCKLVESGGGVVEAPDHTKHLIEAFKEDIGHDLCLVKIPDNLGISLSITSRIPAMGDNAIVVGHPLLLPTIVSHGHFSEHMIIPIQEDSRPCTKEEMDNQNTQFQCLLMGSMPIYTMREGQLISDTIMPGSSGSPVFNTKGEIAGVVFAGSQGLSYGIVVPLESLRTFMEYQKSIDWTLPH